MLDPKACYLALRARDPRFDGRFFVAVSTTGIYCRPICSARTPRIDRCSFFASAALAEKAGFRACLLCRPELAPGNAPLDAVPHLVRRAVALIEDGYLNEHDVDSLAGRLGVTDRHLRRSMEAELGVSPVELAQTRRLALAKQLLHDTRLSLTDVAFASGFQSVRRFNALFSGRFGRPPSALRREQRPRVEPGTLELRLDFRPPLDWEALLGFFAARAIPGVESVQDGRYRRATRIGASSGTIEVRLDPGRPALRAAISLSLAAATMSIVKRLRAMFDLDADPNAIAVALGDDPLLGPVAHRRPGLRLPGAFDVFETTARAILGQQISVVAARTLAGRLVERFGGGTLFPDPASLAGQDLASIGLPRRRADTLRAVAAAFASGELDPQRDPFEEFTSRFLSIPGIGEWTAQVVAMRALGHPDAFPAGDLGVRNALGGVTAREAQALAEAWRPWRSYGALYLWTKGV